MGRGRLEGPPLPLGMRGVMVWVLAIASALGIAWWDFQSMVESSAYEAADVTADAPSVEMVEFEVAPFVESGPADAGND